jgi:hypothetical protein
LLAVRDESYSGNDDLLPLLRRKGVADLFWVLRLVARTDVDLLVLVVAAGGNVDEVNTAGNGFFDKDLRWGGGKRGREGVLLDERGERRDRGELVEEREGGEGWGKKEKNRKHTLACSIPHEMYSPFSFFSPSGCHSVALRRSASAFDLGQFSRTRERSSSRKRRRFSRLPPYLSVRWFERGERMLLPR